MSGHFNQMDPERLCRVLGQTKELDYFSEEENASASEKSAVRYDVWFGFGRCKFGFSPARRFCEEKPGTGVHPGDNWLWQCETKGLGPCATNSAPPIRGLPLSHSYQTYWLH